MTTPTQSGGPELYDPSRPRRGHLRLVTPPSSRYKPRPGEDWLLGLMLVAMAAITVLMMVGILDPGRLVMSSGQSQRPTTTTR